MDLTAYVEKHEFCFDAVLDEHVNNEEVTVLFCTRAFPLACHFCEFVLYNLSVLAYFIHLVQRLFSQLALFYSMKHGGVRFYFLNGIVYKLFWTGIPCYRRANYSYHF